MDYDALKGTKKIKVGKQSASVQITPIADGADGKLSFTVEPTPTTTRRHRPR